MLSNQFPEIYQEFFYKVSQSKSTEMTLRFILTIIPVICHIVSDNCQESMIITWSPCVEREANFAVQFLFKKIMTSSYQRIIKQNTYSKKISIFLNSLIPKLHNSPTSTIPHWKRKSLWVSAILHHWNKLRFLHFIKWLITSDYPFNEESLELGLIPRQLEQIRTWFSINL